MLKILWNICGYLLAIIIIVIIVLIPIILAFICIYICNYLKLIIGTTPSEVVLACMLAIELILIVHFLI